MMGVTPLLFLLLLVSSTLPRLPRPKSVGETLGVGGRAVRDVLRATITPRSSVILLTDGASSTTTVSTQLMGQQVAPWGMTVFEVPVSAVTTRQSLSQSQAAQLFRVIHVARRVREASWSVTLLLVSDNPVFLARVASWCEEEHLLTWPSRLLALTRQPLHNLAPLHPAFSMINSMLVLLQEPDGPSPWCNMYAHLPFTSKVLEVATWTSRRRLTLTAKHLQLFPDKFYRFLEKPLLSVVAEEFPPHVAVKKRLGHGSDVPGQRFLFTGAMTMVLQELAHHLNFSYILYRSPDGSFGNRLPNGTGTGMVGLVNRKEMNLGLGPFSITAVRASLVDYAYPPIVSDSLRIMGGRGKPEVDPWGFLLPLAPLVWAALLGSLVLMLVTVVVLAYFFSDNAPVMPMIAVYLRVLLQENSWVPSERWWERVLLMAWLVLMLVLTQSYSGNLMSLLAVRYIPQPFQSLRLLLDHQPTIMVWEYDTGYVSYFRTSVSGIFKEVRDSEERGRIEYSLAKDYPDMLDQQVRKGTHTFIGEDLTIKVLIANDFSSIGQCDFYTSREAFMPFHYSLIGPKYSPLILSIGKRFLLIKESGVYNHWMQSQNLNSSVCLRPPTKITVKSSLAFTNVWGMAVVFGVGVSLGVFALAVELFKDHRRESNKLSGPPTLSVY